MTGKQTSMRGRLADRWPTGLGLLGVAGAITVIVLDDRDAGVFGPIVVGMAGMYMIAYAIGLQWTVWVGFAVLSAVVSVLQALRDREVSWADPAIGMTVVVVLLWLWAVARGRYKERDTFWVQTVGMVGFAALTLLCAAVDPRWGAAVAGVGFFAHGLWDAYHFKINKVVSRSYAEFCAVVDVGVGTALIIAAIVA